MKRPRPDSPEQQLRFVLAEILATEQGEWPSEDERLFARKKAMNKAATMIDRIPTPAERLRALRAEAASADAAQGQPNATRGGEREAFEARMRVLYPKIGNALNRENGEYHYPPVREHWETWQAARASHPNAGGATEAEVEALEKRYRNLGDRAAETAYHVAGDAIALLRRGIKS